MIKYGNMPVCDLRNLNDVEQIKQIEEICNIALLILPKNSSDEVMSAISAITKSNIASTIYLLKEDDVHILNGCTEITDSDFSEEVNTVVVANGVVIIKSISKETKGLVVANGLIVLHESIKSDCSLTFPMMNGVRTYMDFDHYKIFGDEIEIDSEFLSYIAPKTLVIAGNKIVLGKNITTEILREKQVILLAGNQIVCYEDIASYIKATATVGNTIEVLPLPSNE